MKSANTSLRICLANNLFVRADAKKDSKKLLYFAYLVPLSIPCGTRLRGTSLHDIIPLGFCGFLHPRPIVHMTLIFLGIVARRQGGVVVTVLGGGGWGVVRGQAWVVDVISRTAVCVCLCVQWNGAERGAGKQ